MTAASRTADVGLSLMPIGHVRSPWKDKQSAPRQPAAARGVEGTIELLPEAALEHALEDMEAWSHIWVLFWFHRNSRWTPKVLPPRSAKKRGVFSTRAPHRPNPLGLSALRLLGVRGRILHVSDLDILDGTPIFDLKPYVPYTDAIPNASSGWLEGATGNLSQPEPQDPGPRYELSYSELARDQLSWLRAHAAFDVQSAAEAVLRLGPTPHPYRRIKALKDRYRLAVKDFRLHFVVRGSEVHVLDVTSGYRAKVLQDSSATSTEATPLDVHRAFTSRYAAVAACVSVRPT